LFNASKVKRNFQQNQLQNFYLCVCLFA